MDGRQSAVTQTIFPGQTGQQLIDNLVATYKPSVVLDYDTARDTLFGVIYNHDDSLTGVYSGYTIYLDPAQDPSSYAYAHDINTEHTWPRSKGATGMAKSDMHHLYPTRVEVNADRSNDPFAEIPDADTDRWYRKDQMLTTIPTQNIDQYSEKDFDLSHFEPREDHKGNVARAMFYFYTMYKSKADSADPNFFPFEKNILRNWHQQDPADALEETRTNLIAQYQDNKPNPFVLDPTLVDRAYFSGSSGSGAQPGDLVITEFMANPAVVSDANGEYVEFYNTTDADIDIDGFILKDDGSDSHTIANNGPLIVGARDFIVLGIDGSPATNGGYQPDYVYTNFYLSNSADEIVLLSGSSEIARLNYTNGDPFGPGVSAELADVADAVNGVSYQSDYVAASSAFGAGDLGSPGSDGNTLGTGSGVSASVKIFLEGCYDATGDSMHTRLNRDNLMPLTQPYGGSPWNYSGSESVAAFPQGTVDWVLLELRSGTDVGSQVARRAALLLKNGQVTDTDGISSVAFPAVVSGQYYIVVRHRNHLAAMTAVPVTLRTTSSLYDFSDSPAKAYSGGSPGTKALESGMYGLYSGDGDGNGLVDGNDRTVIWLPQDGTVWQYGKAGDFNLDGAIDAIDCNEYWLPNNGMASQVP